MMARRRSKNSPRRSGSAPGQLGLFDALDPAPASRERTAARTVRAPKRTRVQPAALATPQRSVVLNPREAAQYLGVSVSTLKLWRAKKIGPRWTMRGARLIGYRPADLEQFLDDNSGKR